MATVPSIPNTNRIADFTASAGQTVFPIPWPVIADSEALAANDITVSVNGVMQSPVNYQFTGNAITNVTGEWNGGSIKLTNSCVGGERVIIYSSRTPRRTGNYLEGKSLPFTELDKLMDDFAIMLRDIDLGLKRSLQLTPTQFLDGGSSSDIVSAVLAAAITAAASQAAAAVSAGQAAASASSVNTAFRNRILNGNMRVNNRNAGGSIDFTNTKTYVLDRWYGQSSSLSTQTIAGQRVAGTLAGFVSSLKFTVGGTGAAPAAGAYAFVAQVIEGVNVSDLLWGTASAKPITISFRAKASVTGTYGLTLLNSASDRSYVASFALNAGVDTAVSLTIPGDTSGTWLIDTGIGMYVAFDLGAGSSRSGAAGAWSGSNLLGLTGGTKLIATTGATFEVSGVQLEVGSAATAYEQTEHSSTLARCTRYFRSKVYAIGENLAQFAAYSTTQANGRMFDFDVPMRVAPTAGLAAGNFIAYSASQGNNSGFSSFTFLPSATGLAGSGALAIPILAAGDTTLLTAGVAGATLYLDADF